MEQGLARFGEGDGFASKVMRALNDTFLARYLQQVYRYCRESYAMTRRRDFSLIKLMSAKATTVWHTGRVLGTNIFTGRTFNLLFFNSLPMTW